MDLVNWKIGKHSHHGIVVPLFSLKTAESSGIGEFLDLIPLIDLLAETGMTILQLLPINDTGGDPSPYSALSAFALNPIHLSLSAIELSPLIHLNNALRVDHPLIYAEKEKLLWGLYSREGHKFRNNEFESNNPWLLGYALFKTLSEERNRLPWWEWEADLQNPSLENFAEYCEKKKERIQFHIFLQTLCFEQFKNVKEYAQKKGVLIMGDIPILVRKDSADVWLNRQLFNLEINAGAPPDMYSAEGQAWGTPIYRWDNLEIEDNSFWRTRLQVAEQLYDLYRIDHVIGLFRFWGVPEGKKPIEGHYIPSDFKDAMVLGEKSLRLFLELSSMLPVAEDLGVIPTEVRVVLKELEIPGTKVMRWERYWDDGGAYIPVHLYSSMSMTTVSTHDSETLRGWWTGCGIEVKEFAEQFNLQYTPNLDTESHKKILKLSHETTSLLHINLLSEYLSLFPEKFPLTAEEERINVPGIVSDKNWTIRYPWYVEDMKTFAPLLDTLRFMQNS